MPNEEKKLPPLTDFVPMKFTVDVEIEAAIGSLGRGQVQINDRPFVLKKITHQIIAHEPNQNVYQQQDGLYRIDWSEYEQVRFWKGSIPLADAAYGSIRDGRWQPLDAPVTLPGGQTLHVQILNEAARLEKFQVQVIFHGIQRLGSLTQQIAQQPTVTP